MFVAPQVFAGPDDLGAAAAGLVAERIAARPAGGRFVLGCPGGRSARSTYEHLARLAGRRRLDLSGLLVVMMDEYVSIGPDGEAESVPPDRPHACRRFGAQEIVGRLNAALTEAGCPSRYRVPPDQLWLPDPADPGAYEEQLDEVGGVDVFLLASGAGDGHVAFNTPGSAAQSRTRVVRLPETTRRDNLVTFPSFGGDLDAVPTHGVTVGVATIRERSAEVVMLVHGADKQHAARRLIEAEHYQSDWPATVLADCRSPHLFVDRVALAHRPLPVG